MLSLESRVVADPTALSTAVGDEIVVMDPSLGKYFSFQAVSADIWRALRDPQSVGGLCEALAASYDAPLDRIQVSVLAFLSQLLERRLIKLA
ncbi:MAG: PqqD family protein [Phenylobacterium sp.]